jgi:Tol biopolymer transport system component
MNPDGSGKQNLTQDTSALSYDTGPSWSPDGKRIAFDHVFDDPPNTVKGGNSYLYVINRDGSGRTELKPTGGFLIHPPAWSPDGRKIALSRNYSHVYVVNQDGSGEINITPDALQVGNPDWQPIPGPKRGDYKNAAKFCKAERDFLGERQFRQEYGTDPKGANAYGRCVSGK